MAKVTSDVNNSRYFYALYKSVYGSFPANTLRKSNVILKLYFGNLRKLLSANADVT